MWTRDAALAELQTQSLALAEIASALIHEDSGDQLTRDPLPSCQELLDIVLSLLVVDPSPLHSLPATFATRPSRVGAGHER